MTDGWIALVVAIVAASGAWVTTRFGRVAKLERRIDALERRERMLWMHTRHVMDMYYRHREPGAPDLPEMPEGVFGDDTKE